MAVAAEEATGRRERRREVSEDLRCHHRHARGVPSCILLGVSSCPTAPSKQKHSHHQHLLTHAANDAHRSNGPTTTHASGWAGRCCCCCRGDHAQGWPVCVCEEKISRNVASTITEWNARGVVKTPLGVWVAGRRGQSANEGCVVRHCISDVLLGSRQGVITCRRLLSSLSLTRFWWW